MELSQELKQMSLIMTLFEQLDPAAKTHLYGKFKQVLETPPKDKIVRLRKKTAGVESCETAAN